MSESDIYSDLSMDSWCGRSPSELVSPDLLRRMDDWERCSKDCGKSGLDS